MTCVRFLSFMLLLLFTPTSAQVPIFLYNFCQNSTAKSISTSYKSNVNNFLLWINSDSAKGTKFNHTTIGSNSIGVDDDVYGNYNCRYDIASSFCQFCINSAVKEIVQRCPNSDTVVIFYDVCIIRYSNKNFFGKVSVTPSWNVTGSKNIKDSTELTKEEDYIRILIRKATVDTNQSWASSEFNSSETGKRYGFLQCAKDLDKEGCRQCLEAVLDLVPKCCGTKVAWEVVVPSCGIKFDDQKFFQLNDQPESSSSEPNPVTVAAKKKGTSKSRNLIIGFSVLGSVILLSFTIYCFWSKNRVRKDWLAPAYEETLNVDLPTIPLITVQHCTNNFSETSKLGEGGFGSVYKGILPDGRQIAVKRLSRTSGQGSEEFKNEVMFIAKLQHRNLVRLIACCLEGNEKLLVYEYMPNASLDFHLFDNEKRKELNWKLSLSIVNGIAKGLLYLHEDSRLRVIHRDLKASNVLLDHEMNPKISDFGLARAFDIGQNQANTRRIMGTYGYMAPEYAMEGVFSVKTDVFSFGVLVLEIISGKKNTGFYLSEHGQSLLLYTWKKWCEGTCLEIMDSVLGKSCIDDNEVVRCINIGLLCVQEDAADRPTMSTVVVMLASDTMTLPKPKQPAFSIGRMTSNDSSTSKSSKDPSINDVTVSNILPR